MILSEVNDGVRLLTMNRPEVLNAFNLDLMEAMAEAFVEARDDPATKVVVLTGAGRAFSAGADLTGQAVAGRTYKYGFQGLVEIIIDFPKPFIAAVNGVGVGVGATILGLADMAFMAESARLRCPFSALGLTAEACSTYTFPRIMGPQAANRFLLGAEWWSSAQCKADRLVLDVYPDEGFLERVLGHASDLAKLPLASLIQTKDLMMAPHREVMKRVNAEENKGLAALRGGPANIEAVTAFREKREPNFAGM